MEPPYLAGKSAMNIQVQYGTDTLRAQLPRKAHVRVLEKRKAEHPQDKDEMIAQALTQPIGSRRLKDMVDQEGRVVIVTSDITRPFPTAKVLPHVVRELQQGGVPLSNITVVFALGNHRGHTKTEMRTLAGALYDSEIRFVDTDPNNCMYLGTTLLGTPVELFRPAAEADVLILMGNIEYHYFAGYSGGAKALMPGTASRAAIAKNHSMISLPGAQAGKLVANPVREDIDEVGQFIKIDFLVNAVLNEQNEIAAIVCGDYIKAHRVGCRKLDYYSRVEVKEEADIVIIGGGYPKDINLYQAQKWLENGRTVAADKGILIWCARAEEGFGNQIFRQWMLTKDPEEMIRHNFVLGGHKAAAVGKILLNHPVYLVSHLKDEEVRKMGMVPFKGLQAAVDAAVNAKGEDASVLVFPKAMTILPVFYDD